MQQTKARMDAVFRTATLRLIQLMQTPGSYVPLDTGALRASLVVVVNGPPPQPREEEPKHPTTTWDESMVISTIATAHAGDVITAAYTTAYARRLEYGFVGQDSLGRNINQAGLGWTRRAAQQWPRLVEEAARDAQAAVAANQAGQNRPRRR
ncbi:hypothetical protein [Methylobacterium nodulans]|uniref:hypothetical protein n=1 Tax=Methylobacterium nodulans TaxID=114616 RepID=UPI000302D46E|nr:hypothetical protein [Methylobacterium nodulans]